MTEQTQTSPVMVQINVLNLRINDMMSQLGATLKTVMDENTALRNELADLKVKPEKSNNH